MSTSFQLYCFTKLFTLVHLKPDIKLGISKMETVEEFSPARGEENKLKVKYAKIHSWPFIISE